MREPTLLAAPALLAVALVSGAIIAYELFIMRIFANGGWSHFGSTVVSIAMFGFGAFSTVLCIGKEAFSRRSGPLTAWSLLLLGPLMVGANAAAQQVPFNPIFLAADPRQKYLLILYFLIYFVPFFVGAMFLGLVFLQGREQFGRVYFANMAGSGLGGLALFGAMYLWLPERLYLAPALLWAGGALLWLWQSAAPRLLAGLALSAALILALGWLLPQLTVSPYKGVSYARNLPDARLVHRAAGPFGHLEVYESSYFHFAPGLSDTAALNLQDFPKNAYLGMYLDGDGPIGVMRALPPEQQAYMHYLPMAMPYLLHRAPEVLVLQFGGGISTNVALARGAQSVTVAEGNPMIRRAFESPELTRFTGHLLSRPGVRVVPREGRLAVQGVHRAYDLIDLSLADSTGLSMPAGAAIQEKFDYTQETFAACLKALKPGGVLAVTLWNKEDPPKAALRVMATLLAAARAEDAGPLHHKVFVAHTYLATLTMLYRQGGFSPADYRTLEDYCRKMNFEVLYGTSLAPPVMATDRYLQLFREAYFETGESEVGGGGDLDVSAGALYRHVLREMISGDPAVVEGHYLFHIRPLTNDRPFLAGYVKPGDFPRYWERLESIADEWGYLLLWATLGMAVLIGVLLLLLPVMFGWRAIFAPQPGKMGILLYFLCLGVGYMLVEIGLISTYVLCLGNPTVSVTVLITGMLIFSGLGSYLSGGIKQPLRSLGFIAGGIAALLLLYALALDRLLGAAAAWPYALKVGYSLVLLFPLAFLMGFPFPLGMATLSRLKKDHFFVWAWGINGSFSVVGSVLVPLIAVTWGVAAVLLLAGALYLLALPAFVGLTRPAPSA